jgi:hypothetical protein
LTPVVAAAIAAGTIRDAGRESGKGPPVARIAFSVAALGFVALLHLAWLLDWGGTATGSSTAGLIFLFAPIYTMLIATGTAAITRIGVTAYGRFRPGA